MSRLYLADKLRKTVRRRARYACEYCLLHEDDTQFAHPIDHVVAVKHGGASRLENLALACLKCNSHKGPDLTTFDPLSGQLARLFNPRAQIWREHFALQGAQILGLTPEGRATVFLLRMNDPVRLSQRRRLAAMSRYPSPSLIE